MNSKEHRQQKDLRRTAQLLKRASFGLYTQVLARLLESQREHRFLQPIAVALRAKRWKEVYAAADFLSTQQYPTAHEHFVANQFTLLIKKYPWKPKLLGFDPELTAYQAFLAAEKRCGLINRKFSLLMLDPSRDKLRAERGVARAWIRDLLGPRPDYRAIFRKCEFGQGASVGIHGDATHVIRKLSVEQGWTVTPGAIHHGFGGLLNNRHYLETLLEGKMIDGRWVVCLDYVAAFTAYARRMNVVTSNKISFVLKTAKTHRSIAVEPMLNGFVQTGIDQCLRLALKTKADIDLTDQSRNQRFARDGSIDDSEEGFVTIDLRGASNSNAVGPVEYLYPRGWVDLFHRTRSHYYEYNGLTAKYNMLCSMGNGFCFPVETITFVALCIAAGAGTPGVDFTVYGDDIIVRKKHSVKLLSLLKHYGFSLNTEKTFLEGPFRESCGADWFKGEDVRPFTLDFAFDTVENFFKYLNLTQRSEKTSAFFAPVRSLVVRRLPTQYQFFRPLKGEVDSGIDSLGDEHLTCQHCTFDRRSGAWSWKELVRTPVSDRDRILRWEHEPWLMGVALRGSKSVPYGPTQGLPDVAFRRKTRAKVARESYASTSNWLPPREI